MFHSSGLEKNINRIGKEGGELFMHIVTFVKATLLSSCFCFVALVVLLRLLAVRKPLETQTLHKKIGCIGSIICWVFPLFANLIPPTICLTFLDDKVARIIIYYTVFILTHGVPILSVIIIYTFLLYTLKQTKSANESDSKRKRSLAMMIKGIVICVVVFNVPYIAWMTYFAVLYKDGRESEAFTTNCGVSTTTNIEYRI